MDNTRISRINRLVQKELGEIFRLQTQALQGVIVSVTSVRISADLGIARVNLSIFPSERATEILSNIKAQSKSVRYDLGSKVRTQLRHIPELHFYLDDSLDYIERIDDLLKK